MSDPSEEAAANSQHPEVKVEVEPEPEPEPESKPEPGTDSEKAPEENAVDGESRIEPILCESHCSLLHG